MALARGSTARDAAAGSTGRTATSRLSVLAPVERQTVRDRVYRELRKSLIEGLFDAGEVLRIQELANTLETSTMPVRDALARLISERALEPLPNRSVRVPLLTRERLDDIAHARALIEGEAIALAIPNLKPADIGELRRLTKAYDESMALDDQHARRAAYNHAFHFGIYRAAGSNVLIPIIESLWLQSGPFIRASAGIYDGADGLSATHYHWMIIDALAGRDVAAAKEALGSDIGRACDLLRVRFAREGRASEEDVA